MPGTGKTEIIKQVARVTGERIWASSSAVYLLLVDGATIAASKWGEAEELTRKVFQFNRWLKTRITRPKVILLFDDIESTMLGREVSLAKEWHFSINSVFFHELDMVNPSEVMVFATTNRSDLVDEAIKSRLYVLDIPLPAVDDLKTVIIEILKYSGIDQIKFDEITQAVTIKLKKINKPTIRDARELTLLEIVEREGWI